MKKTGFTIAEILITLGIIGVVAALTLPSLSVNIQQQKIGPSLAKAVNSFETSMQTLLATTQTRTLDVACGGINVNLPACLIQANLQGFPAPLGAKYYNWDGSEAFTLSADNTGIITKDGIAFIQEGAAENVSSERPIYSGGGQFVFNSRRYGNVNYNIIVDIDGPDRGQNTYGVDTFKFRVNSRGIMIPIGGSLQSSYDTEMGINWKPAHPGDSHQNPTPQWRGIMTNGSGDAACNEGGISGTGESCTAAVVENGYKALYRMRDWTSSGKIYEEYSKPNTDIGAEQEVNTVIK